MRPNPLMPTFTAIALYLRNDERATG